MKKGSTAWYQEKTKELNHHVQGMKAINAHRKFILARCIIEMSKDLVKKLNIKLTPNENMIKLSSLMKEAEQILVLKIKNYLS